MRQASLRWLETIHLSASCSACESLVITYDDGPGASTTPKLLDRLSSCGVRATFFLIGQRAEQAPSIADRIEAEGHEIGCHTQQHLHAWRVSSAEAIADINDGYRTLSRWVEPDGLFRPPYGKMTWTTWKAVRRDRGAPIGWWTIDSGDTADRLPDPATIVERVRRKRGGVVLMHDFDRERPDADERRRFVLETTERLLALAEAEGLNVMPLGELLKLTNGQRAG